MTAAAAQVRAILRDAARLLWRHWPALLTLGLLGAAWRSGALWLAVIVSDHAGFAAQLLLALAPIGYLLALVAMLRVCRPSLAPLLAADAATAPMAATERRPVRLLDIAVSILVPFLAAYIGYGLLEQDLARFTNVAAYDEFNQFDLTREVDYDFAGRLALYAWPIALAIMLGAWIVRWGLGRAEARTGVAALGLLGALVEVYYTGQLAAQSAAVRSGALDWLATRRALAEAARVWDWLLEHLGVVATALAGAAGFAADLLASAEAVFVVPVAWLTVATIVLGHNIFPERPQDPVGTGRGPRWAWLRSLSRDVRERFGAFIDALRTLAGLGLLPMLALCLILLLLVRVPVLASYVVRGLLGPMRTQTWLGIAPIEATATLAVSIALIAPVLAEGRPTAASQRRNSTYCG